MALEDEIINIENLNLVDEIKVGDQILLETSDGTKLIDFKDFIIGVENVTFYDKLTGIDTTVTDSLSAKLQVHESILSEISGVSADINSINRRLAGLESDINGINSAVNNTAAGTINEFTNNKVGFSMIISTDTKISSTKSIVFNSINFQGSSLTEGSDISKGSSSQSAYYKAKGTYGLLLQGTFNINHTTTNADLALDLYINNTKSVSFPVVETIRNGTRSFASFSHYVNLVANDKITLILTGISTATATQGTFTGTKI